MVPCHAHSAAPRLPAGYIQAPLVHQATSYSCGAAAMLSALYYWQAFDGRETDLYPLLGTDPKQGSDPRTMTKAVKDLGLQAEMRENLTLEDLAAALKKGETVILDIQAWHDGPPPKSWKDQWEDGHYVVLVGLDADNVYLMDPSVPNAYAWLPASELPDRWHDYEDRTGTVWRNQHLGIVISGKKHIETYPLALERVD